MLNIPNGIDKNKALARMQSLCARQEKCTADIRQKLHLLGLSNDDILWVIKRLIDDGYVNDSRYAHFFVCDKSRLNKWGRIKIISTLKSKGIAESIIRDSISELNADTDKKTLNDLISRKAKQVKAKSAYDLQSKLIRFGVSRGFEMELVLDVVKSVVKE